MKLIAKYFFLAEVLFLQFMLDWDNYIFPLQMCFLGGRRRLESSCIQVNMVHMHRMRSSCQFRGACCLHLLNLGHNNQSVSDSSNHICF